MGKTRLERLLGGLIRRGWEVTFSPSRARAELTRRRGGRVKVLMCRGDDEAAGWGDGPREAVERGIFNLLDLVDHKLWEAQNPEDAARLDPIQAKQDEAARWGDAEDGQELTEEGADVGGEPATEPP